MDQTDIAALAGVLDYVGVEVEIELVNDGWVAIRWSQNGNPMGDASFKICNDHLHWGGLWAYFNGALTQLCRVTPDFFRERGVKRFTTFAMTNASWQYIEAVGFEEVLGEPAWLNDAWLNCYGLQDLGDMVLYECALLPKPCRMDEYISWQDNVVPEPLWHQELVVRRAKAQTEWQAQRAAIVAERAINN